MSDARVTVQPLEPAPPIAGEHGCRAYRLDSERMPLARRKAEEVAGQEKIHDAPSSACRNGDAPGNSGQDLIGILRRLSQPVNLVLARWVGRTKIGAV